MKNPNANKKLRAVLIAAICGVVFFDTSMWAAGWIDRSVAPGSNHGMFLDILFGLIQIWAFFLSAITNSVISQPGSKGSELTGDIIISLMGAVVFAFVAAFWQFIVKGRNKI